MGGRLRCGAAGVKAVAEVDFGRFSGAMWCRSSRVDARNDAERFESVGTPSSLLGGVQLFARVLTL